MNTNPDDIGVLVVDDETDIREGCARIIKRMGLRVETASRGDEALDRLRSAADAFSIVLLDLKMPGMDGMEVLERIQEMDPEILVIIITGFATVETAIEAMKQGAYDFIPKPFEPDHLRIVVSRAREKLGLTRETALLEASRARTLADLDTEKSRIRTILEFLPIGIVVTDPNGQVVLMNSSFRQMLNISPDCTLGEPIETYCTDGSFCRFLRSVAAVLQPETKELEFTLDENRYGLARGRPVLGGREGAEESGESLGAVITLIDITEMKLLDQLKSEFVAKVSHELRSPLSTIHEQIAATLRESAADETSDRDHHLLSRAKEKTRSLISLIGDLLDLSRIEAGTSAREIKPVKLDALLESIVDFLSSRAKVKNQTLTFEPPKTDLPEIRADPMALESIFGNLVTNAVNYTPGGGSITVFAEADEAEKEIVVRVKDTGYGIDPKYHEKIFERFFRVKDEQTRRIDGTGLGLPIVKGLVKSMNGSIRVQSEKGKGSTFIVRLPWGESTHE
jgi:PAS domain S-box-containing protein